VISDGVPRSASEDVEARDARVNDTIRKTVMQASNIRAQDVLADGRIERAKLIRTKVILSERRRRRRRARGASQDAVPRHERAQVSPTITVLITRGTDVERADEQAIGIEDQVARRGCVNYLPKLARRVRFLYSPHLTSLPRGVPDMTEDAIPT
jgi:hypothetical protein